VSGQFAVSGWALDLGAPAGTGVDTVHVWAQSLETGAWSFLGAATMAVARPDVAAVFGSGQFAAAGFGLSAALPPGTYDVHTFAHSLVSGTFNNAQSKRITVVTAPSRPVMFIDLPVAEFATTRGTLFAISGWAIDRSSPAGSGIDTIHVWAYPQSGAPIFMGVANPKQPRWDVGAYFGQQFVNSGYSLQGALPQGDYNLVVFAWSSVAQQFNNATGIHMRVF
jgi:hypothetical protein